MEDRLRELQAANPPAPPQAANAPAAPAQPETESEFMKDFFLDVGQVKSIMTNIRINIGKLEEKYAQLLSTVNMEQAAREANDVNQLVDQNNKFISNVRSLLESMKNKISTDSQSTPTELRIRTNMLATLAQKFKKLAQDYQTIQASYKAKTEEKIARQCTIVKPEVTQEEIEQVIESGDTSKIFQSSVIDANRKEQATKALAYVEARHADIKRIEASIQQLHQLFVDMAIIVDAQGEMLDQIEFNILQAADYVAKGKDQLAAAVKLQKKSRCQIQ